MTTPTLDRERILARVEELARAGDVRRLRDIRDLVAGAAAKRQSARNAALYAADPVGWVRGRLGQTVWSKQAEIMESVRDHRRTAVRSCHGAGKALDLRTVLPTPTGWTTMADVQVGDRLLDEHGQPVIVTAISAVQHRPTYRVRFDDGTELTASDNHEWQVIDIRHRPRKIADWRDHWSATVTRTTQQLAAEMRENGQFRWRVPTCRPIAGSPVALPVPPYTLGAWLGDGHTLSAAITCSHDDAGHLLAQLDADGVPHRPRPSAMRERSGAYAILGLLPGLRALGVLGHKHVPDVVLRADVATRLAVLQGLMDTDGFVSSGQSVGIDLCCEKLADGVAALVTSLGWKAFRSTKPAKLNGRIVGTVYRLQFRPDQPVFRLPRKANRLGKIVNQRSRHTQRTVVAVDPIGIVPTKCVMVDSPTHLYLAGESMVPTHNSHLASLTASWWLDVHPPGTAFVVSTAPTFAQVRAILWRYIRRVHKAGGLPGRVNQTEWHMDGELVAFGRKPSDHDESAFQGIHARYVLVIVDEACGVPEQLWIAADSLTTNPDCRILAIGNPDNPASHFRKVCVPGSGWNTIGISAFDTPNFTGEEVPKALARVLISREWVEEKARDWGEDSPVYRSKVGGEFSEDAPNQVVRQSDLALCRIAPDVPHPPEDLLPVELGVDVGGGSDETVIRERRGRVAGREWRRLTDRPEVIAPMVLQAIRETGATSVKIDSIGVGFGVVGELRNMAAEGLHKARIIAVNVGGASSKPRVYLNLRAEIWWEIGRELSEDRIAGWDLSTMDNADATVAQLLEPRYDPDAKGRIVVEKKEDVIKRLGRSPDNADALLLAFYRGQRGSTVAAPSGAMPSSGFSPLATSGGGGGFSSL